MICRFSASFTWDSRRDHRHFVFSFAAGVRKQSFVGLANRIAPGACEKKFSSVTVKISIRQRICTDRGGDQPFRRGDNFWRVQRRAVTVPESPFEASTETSSRLGSKDYSERTLNWKGKLEYPFDWWCNQRGLRILRGSLNNTMETKMKQPVFRRFSGTFRSR